MSKAEAISTAIAKLISGIKTSLLKVAALTYHRTGREILDTHIQYLLQSIQYTCIFPSVK